METKIIGNKIAEARKQLNMSQAQLAERLFISPQAVGKWERGESMPDITTFGRMAKILGVDLNYFSANSQDPCPAGLTDNPSTEHPAVPASAQTSAPAPVSASAQAPTPAQIPDNNPASKKRPVRNMSANTWTEVDFSGLNNIKETVNAANFQRCRFIDSDLMGLVLKNDVMHDCDFSGSNLNQCRFQGSNLEGNTYSRCSLVEADFSASTVKGCNFEGADMNKTFFNFSTIETFRFFC